VKILYISQYFPPEMGAPAARVSELSRHWRESGHAVTVLTGFPNHPTGKIPPEYRRKFRRGFMREQFHGVNVVRTWLLPFANRKAYERMLNYSSFCLSAGITGAFLEQPDVVIATSPQLLVGLTGWWIARCKRVPFIFEVRDLWPESLSAVGATQESSVLYRMLARVARFLYNNANHVVVVTPAFKDHLVKYWNIPQEKISIVPNGVETEMFSPRNGELLCNELGLQGKFVVSYIGTMGSAHGLETVLKAAEVLQSRVPKVVFLLVGEGAEKQQVLASAQSRGLKNLIILGAQPRQSIPEFIAASNVCTVLLKKAELFETVIPTKMLEFMACARAVILGVRGQAERIVSEAQAGIAIEPENPEQLCEAVVKLAADPALVETMGRNGREYILRNLSRQQTAMEYAAILQELLSGKVPCCERAAAA
jgi:putative colanic acid biosynthesis glycosyltransferase WcaI